MGDLRKIHGPFSAYDKDQKMRFCFTSVALVFSLTAMASSVATAATFPVDVKGTYLFVDNDSFAEFPEPRPEGDRARAPTTIDITDAAPPGERLAFRQIGSLNNGVEEVDQMTGVFRSADGSFLAPASGGNQNTFFSFPTSPRGLPTDISQDFFIGKDVTIATVPVGATSVSFTHPDSFYRDNVSLGFGVEVFDFEDVVSNSVTPVTNSTASNGQVSQMNATFKPNAGFSLDDAALLGGFKSFAWVSYVLSDTGFSACLSGQRTAGCEKLSSLQDQNGNLPTLPHIDPIPGGYQYQRDVGQTVDLLPFYDNLGEEIILDDSLVFSDAPLGLSNSTMTFRTLLSGVTDANDPTLILLPGTWFEWTVSTGAYDDTLIDFILRAPGNSVPDVDIETVIAFQMLDPSVDFGNVEKTLFLDGGVDILGNFALTGVTPIPLGSSIFLLSTSIVMIFIRSVFWPGIRRNISSKIA